MPCFEIKNRIPPAFTALLTLLAAHACCFAQNSTRPAPVLPSLAPFGAPGSNALHTAWHLSGLPGNYAAPRTQFEWSVLEGEPALQVTTNKSYGVLTHAWEGTPPAQLTWRWRMEQSLEKADIATKAGDDAALKVCVMFDQPISEIPLLQRASLALARSASGQEIPNATLCYVWDNYYPAGTEGANPYSARVRYIVLQGPGTARGQWVTERRQTGQDFQRLFGKESSLTPPVIAVAVGADSDNTQGQSRAYINQLRWLP